MTLLFARKRPLMGALLVALMAGTAVPAAAQTTADPDVRIRKLEAEVRALQRQVFPGSDGKFFTPEITQGTAPASTIGTPASTPMADLLTRMQAVESQITRLTAQNEETANRVAQMEARLTAMASAQPAAVASPGIATAPAVSASPSASAATAPAPALAATPAATAAAKPAPATTRPAPAAKPSAQRVAAVQKIEKPATSDPADDEYSYGFRLWDAKFYPEAQLQLRMYVDKYPRDSRISFGRNLLGRAYLDDGKPREAAPWFLQNYQADKKGTRAPDSLLFLAESMRQLKDTSRACIALGEFAETYAAEAAGRLKSQYDATRAAAKCG